MKEHTAVMALCVLVHLMIGVNLLLAAEHPKYYLGTLAQGPQESASILFRIEPTKRVVKIKLSDATKSYGGVRNDLNTMIHPDNSLNLDSVKTLMQKPVLIKSMSTLHEGLNNQVEFIAAIAPPGREFSEAKQVIDFLKSKYPAIAEEFVCRLFVCARSAEHEIALGRGDTPHLVVGQLEVEGNANPRSASFHSQIMDRGYFVTVCTDVNVPMSCDLHGYRPAEIRRTKTQRLVENVGAVKLQKAQENSRAEITFKLPTELEQDKRKKEVFLTTQVRSASASGFFPQPDTILNVTTKRETDGRYKSAPLTPGLQYLLVVRFEGKSYGTSLTLSDAENRDLSVLKEMPVQNAASPRTPQSSSGNSEREFEQAVQQFKQIATSVSKSQTGNKAFVLSARLQIEGKQPQSLMMAVTSNFRLIADGRMVGLVRDLDEPFFIRAYGYREKSIVAAEIASDLTKTNDLIDLGTIALEPLTAGEGCVVSGRVAFKPFDIPTHQKPPGEVSAYVYMSEIRNSPRGSVGDSAQLPVTVDSAGEFTLPALTTGSYLLVIAGKDIADSQTPFVVPDQSEYKLPPVVLSPKLKARVSWRWSNDLPFSPDNVNAGEISAYDDWFATDEWPTERNRPSDLRCSVKVGRMQLDSSYGPTYYTDLGEGNLTDFSDVGQERVSNVQKGVDMLPGHVYLIHRPHSKRYILLKVHLIMPVGPALELSPPEQDIAQWLTSIGGNFESHLNIADPTNDTSVHDARPTIFTVNLEVKTRGKITDKDLRRLLPLKQLEVFNIAHSTLNDNALKTASEFSELKHINVWNTSVTNAGLASLRPLKKLEFVNVGLSKVTFDGLKGLQLENLKQLYLNRAGATPNGLATISKCKKLELLSLWETRIGDVDLKALSLLPVLRDLNLERTQITDAGLAHLHSIASLRTLTLTGCKLSEQSITQLKEQLPKCNVIR